MNQRVTAEDTRRVGALIPESHARALERSAEENGRTLASEIRLAIAEWLRQHGRIAA
jgi:hypothetical protein